MDQYHFQRINERLDKAVEAIAALTERIGFSAQTSAEFKVEIKAEIAKVIAKQDEMENFITKVKGGWVGISVLMTIASGLGAGLAWLFEHLVK